MQTIEWWWYCLYDYGFYVWYVLKLKGTLHIYIERHSCFILCISCIPCVHDIILTLLPLFVLPLPALFGFSFRLLFSVSAFVLLYASRTHFSYVSRSNVTNSCTRFSSGWTNSTKKRSVYAYANFDWSFHWQVSYYILHIQKRTQT